MLATPRHGQGLCAEAFWGPRDNDTLPEGPNAERGAAGPSDAGRMYADERHSPVSKDGRARADQGASLTLPRPAVPARRRSRRLGPPQPREQRAEPLGPRVHRHHPPAAAAARTVPHVPRDHPREERRPAQARALVAAG